MKTFASAVILAVALTIYIEGNAAFPFTTVSSLLDVNWDLFLFIQCSSALCVLLCFWMYATNQQVEDMEEEKSTDDPAAMQEETSVETWMVCWVDQILKISHEAWVHSISSLQVALQNTADNPSCNFTGQFFYI